MTAIALLNIEADPHLVADTLLSANGKDSAASKSVWLPALGETPSEWPSLNGTRHIAWLGRKTFFLPNGSGILSFSGSCPAAFRFWGELSESARRAMKDDSSARVDSAMVKDVLRQLPHDAGQFSLLGVLVGASQKRTAFVHGKSVRIETKNFGTCYVAGSGWTLLMEIINQTDHALGAGYQWPLAYPISATEDLAEHISAAMLHTESDHRNGVTPGTPITAYCGGFYEWYGIQPEGIRPMRPRLDLHVTLEKDQLIITRAYFAEQMQKRYPNQNPLPTQRYFLSVVNLILDPYVIPFQNTPSKSGVSIELDECWGTLIPLMLDVYDSPDDALSQKRLSSRLNTKTMQILFPSPVDVSRVRVMVQTRHSKCTAKRFIAQPGESPNAKLTASNGHLTLWLADHVLEATKNTTLTP